MPTIHPDEDPFGVAHMIPELADLIQPDPREAFQTPGQGRCDWCSGPLDQAGLCLARCRSWANENSNSRKEITMTQTTTYKLTDAKGKTIYLSGASIEVVNGAFRARPGLAPWMILWPLDTQNIPTMLAEDIPNGSRAEILDPPVQVTTIQGPPDDQDDLALTCAWCGSQAIETRDYDYGTDPETGYRDAGTVTVCTACGKAEQA